MGQLAAAWNGSAHGLPALYNNSQAGAGARLYSAKCSMCHGAYLEGNNGPPLVGPNVVTLGKKTRLTIGDMFQFITTQMPLNEPASLSHDQYVKIFAFILKQNGYPSRSKALTYSAALANKQLVTSLKR